MRMDYPSGQMTSEEAEHAGYVVQAKARHHRAKELKDKVEAMDTLEKIRMQYYPS